MSERPLTHTSIVWMIHVFPPALPRTAETHRQIGGTSDITSCSHPRSFTHSHLYGTSSTSNLAPSSSLCSTLRNANATARLSAPDLVRSTHSGAGVTSSGPEKVRTTRMRHLRLASTHPPIVTLPLSPSADTDTLSPSRLFLTVSGPIPLLFITFVRYTAIPLPLRLTKGGDAPSTSNLHCLSRLIDLRAQGHHRSLRASLGGLISKACNVTRGTHSWCFEPFRRPFQWLF